MKFSDYRHLANWAATKLVLPNSVHLLKRLAKNPNNIFRNWHSDSNIIALALLPIQETLMKQSGHSAHTAVNAYSVDPDSHPDISNFVMERFFEASELWHCLLTNKLTPKILKQISKSTISGIFSPPFTIKHSCADDCDNSILKNVFGFKSFSSDFQKSCIIKIREEPKNSFLFVAPTGSGTLN